MQTMNRSTRKPDGDGVVGTTLGGKYHLVSVIGHGGMGIVCEARHVGLGKRFAIKIINKGVPRPEVIAARFRREVRAISAIESENIVQVFDAGIDEKLGLYMVMEYLAGEDLAARIARVKRMEAPEVIALGYQIARGLARAHEARIIHRDMKPANIFLVKNEDGTERVKLLDFGVSKLLDGDGSQTWMGQLTTIGMSVGTPQYMSPEQAQGLELDERTDVWSLGVVLYEMLAGRPAYEAHARAHQTIVRIVTERPAPLAEVAPWVPERLAAVIHMALQHDRDARISSAALFADLLADALQTQTHATFEDAETMIAPNPLFPRLRVESSPVAKTARADSRPSGFIQICEVAGPPPAPKSKPVRTVARKRSVVGALWPVVALILAAVVTGHVGGTRGATLAGGAPSLERSPVEKTSMTPTPAPSPAVRRADFSPRFALGR